jgi:histidine triad (HIT) family protein
MKTLFEKIIDREIPATFVYEDDLVVAFRDIAPIAPTHVLVVPRKPIQMLSDVGEEDEAILGRMLHVAKKIADQEGLVNGFRSIINCGNDGGQEVYHLHLHVVGGRKMKGIG